MDVVAQGTLWSDVSDPIRDGSGVAITTGAASIAVTLFDAANVSQSTGITVAHVSAGRYRVSKTLSAGAALGHWTGVLTYSNGSLPSWTQTIDFEVVTAQQADPAASLPTVSAIVSGMLTAGVALTSPLNPATGTLTLRKGNAYSIANGLAPTFDVSGFPSISGDTVEWRAVRDGRTRFTKALTVTDSDTARLELADTDTNKLRVGGAYTYTVVNTTDDITLVTGSLVVTSS